MVNATNKPCIISTHEAKSLAAGDSLMLAVLSDGMCPALRQTDVAILQEQFKKVIESPIKAMAYLWRPESVEAIRADQSLATLETCQDIATPLRCEAVKAYAEGRMSQMVIEEEVRTTGVTKCDWRARLSEKKWEWLHYLNANKPYIDNSVQVDGQLLGTLELMSEFITYSGVVWSEGKSMQDMACSQQMDCDVVSTVVVDHLRQVGLAVSGHVSVFDISEMAGGNEGHVTLQFTDLDGESLFFDNGVGFLLEIESQELFHALDPWQILSGHYASLSYELMQKNNFSDAAIMIQKAQDLDPQHKGAYIFEGALLFHQGDVEGATKKINRELAIDPRAKGAHYLFALICKQRGDVERAISELKAEFAIDPKNVEVKAALANLTLWKLMHDAKAKPRKPWSM